MHDKETECKFCDDIKNTDKLVDNDGGAERIRDIAIEISNLIKEVEDIVRSHNKGNIDGYLKAYVFDHIRECISKNNHFNTDLEDVSVWVDRKMQIENKDE